MEVALIVAGGKGQRMQLNSPKQFVEIGGSPVLFHTINAFRSYSKTIKLLLVLPQDQIAVWEKLCDKYNFQEDLQVVSGGNTRFQSVKNGLVLVEDDDIVAIHDGVRPLVSIEIIKSSFEMAKRNGNAITSVPLKDSIRQIVDVYTNEALDRSKLRLIQTPQTFQARLIKDAYQIQESDDFTDDASVAEKNGVRINLIDGDHTNMKITTQEDLLLVNKLLETRSD